ncbi:lipoate--protein ligase family protein [Acidianus infernus]|uniref:Lipoate--protein ligase family protein n=1 Tax=Acidianus infernus TaxID=12915 RepID=A0A6A9QG12_ACIIN|nr:biotin/lipoate A/B protein ligase family protein [Acidianus infernus]MUM65134.1 lipoate--protein ligase family protein [Acidianus infernus]
MRVLFYENDENPYFSMAFEESLWRNLKEGKVDNTLRFWRHKNVAIIGYFQLAEEELNFDVIRKYKIDVVRRFTGGGAVYQDMGCLIWTIAVKGPKDGGVNYLYDFLLKGFVNALKHFANVRVENVNDVVVNERKVSGTSATFQEDYYLLHGTLLINTNLELMGKVLKVSKAKLSDKGVSEVKYRVTNLVDALGRKIDTSEIIDAIIKEYSSLLGEKAYFDLPTTDEIKLAEELYEKKYSKPEWNLLRLPSSYFE